MNDMDFFVQCRVEPFCEPVANIVAYAVNAIYRSQEFSPFSWRAGVAYFLRVVMEMQSEPAFYFWRDEPQQVGAVMNLYQIRFFIADEIHALAGKTAGAVFVPARGRQGDVTYAFKPFTGDRADNGGGRFIAAMQGEITHAQRNGPKLRGRKTLAFGHNGKNTVILICFQIGIGNAAGSSDFAPARAKRNVIVR